MRAANSVFERNTPAVILFKKGGLNADENDHLVSSLKEAHETIKGSRSKPLFIVTDINTSEATT